MVSDICIDLILLSPIRIDSIDAEKVDDNFRRPNIQNSISKRYQRPMHVIVRLFFMIKACQICMVKKFKALFAMNN